MQAQRLFDLVAAGAGLLVLSPLLVFIALLVKLTSPGPVFHRGERAGKGGRIFRLYKFRSMVAEAAQLGPGITGAADRRITPVGRWLRRLKLDELPQLINVLKGEMGVVGPRPEDPRYVTLYTPEQRRILAARPGLTSAASVRYLHEEALLQGPDWEETYRRVVLPDKLRIDLDYLERRTFFSDLRLVLETCLVLFR